MPNEERGSGNVFKDLGFENPEEELAKARLASMIYDITEDKECGRDACTPSIITYHASHLLPIAYCLFTSSDQFLNPRSQVSMVFGGVFLEHIGH